MVHHQGALSDANVVLEGAFSSTSPNRRVRVLSVPIEYPMLPTIRVYAPRPHDAATLICGRYDYKCCPLALIYLHSISDSTSSGVTQAPGSYLTERDSHLAACKKETITPEERLRKSRERNRDHSRRSRERKKAFVEGLKKQVTSQPSHVS